MKDAPLTELGSEALGKGVEETKGRVEPGTRATGAAVPGRGVRQSRDRSSGSLCLVAHDDRCKARGKRSESGNRAYGPRPRRGGGGPGRGGLARRLNRYFVVKRSVCADTIARFALCLYRSDGGLFWEASLVQWEADLEQI